MHGRPAGMTDSPDTPGSPARARLLWRLAFGLWFVAVAVIVVHVWLKPASNTVYKDFRAGGTRWLAGENLYPKVDEYIYSPFAAAFFAPFTLLPDRVGGNLWRLLCLAAYAGAFAAWLRQARGVPVESAALAWIFLLPLSVGDFFNGQANPLVIGLLMAAILACRRQRWLLAAFCVGVATYLKVYPLAIGLLLCVLHPRRFPVRLAFALLAIFALSLLLQHPAYALAQYGNWVHSLGMDPRRTLNYFGTYRDFWLLLRVLRIPVSLQGWAILQAASGAALAVYLWMAARRGAPAHQVDFLLLTLGVCWMLLFGPATESSTYVILAPPLALAWVRWRGDALSGKFLPGAIACYALLIASQMLTSWGHQYQNPCTHLIQPAGALIFLATLLASARTDARLAPRASGD